MTIDDADGARAAAEHRLSLGHRSIDTALLPEGPVRPTPVLALSDQLALGALQYTRKHRLSLPGALSLMGFDEATPGRTSHPALTTVAQPIRERGTAAGSLMRSLLRGDL